MPNAIPKVRYLYGYLVFFWSDERKPLAPKTADTLPPPTGGGFLFCAFFLQIYKLYCFYCIIGIGEFL